MQVHDTAAAIGRRFLEEQDRLKGGPAADLCAADYQAVIGGNPPMDRAGHEAFSRGFYAAFTSLQHRVEESFASGDDRVAVRFTLSGTHTAPFFGLPASGRSITVTANVVMHLRNGQVARLYGAFDEAGLLRQLGVKL